MIKTVNGYFVLCNSLVLKETEHAFTFYNLGILNGENGCYLEHYITKEKFDIEKFSKILNDELIYNEEFKDILENSKKLEKNFDTNNRISNSRLEKLILSIKMNLGINEEDDLLDLNMSEETCYKIDLNKYIKEGIESMIRIKEIEEEIKKSKTKEKKKSLIQKIKDSIKISGRIGIIGALFASTLAGSMSFVETVEASGNNINGDGINNYSESVSMRDFQFKINNERNPELGSILNKIIGIKYKDINIGGLGKHKIDITGVNVEQSFYLRINEGEDILFRGVSIFDGFRGTVYIKTSDGFEHKIIVSNSTGKNGSITSLSRGDINELPSGGDFGVGLMALFMLGMLGKGISKGLKNL